jgi:probable DNA repair protein
MQTVLAALADGVTVVTANNRLARHVALAFNRAQRAAGRGAWRSPDVIPWNAWLQQLWATAAFQQSAARQRTLLDEVQTRILWQQLIESAQPDATWGTAGAMARLAMQAWQLCQSWQVSLEELEAAADSDDSALFASWAVDYRTRCEEGRWTDLASAADILAGELPRGVPVAEQLLFAGFDTWSPQQQRLLQRLEQAGTRVTRAPLPDCRPCQVQQVPCVDAAEELDMAARWARALREGAPEAVLGVVVPDLARRTDEVRRAFLDVFVPDWRFGSEAGQAINLSYGTPLASVPSIHVALVGLAALQGRLDYRDLGQLLRTPYVAGASVEWAGRARLDVALRARIGTMVELDAAIAIGKQVAPMFCELVARMLAQRETWPNRQSPGRWTQAFTQGLACLGWPGDRTRSSEEYQAELAWRRLLETFAGAGPVLGPLSLPAALAALRSLGGEQVFQPEGRSDAVQVMGALEAVGQLFDGLWVCGLDSDHWPPAGRPSPVLPLSLQRRLGMPDSSPAMVRERAERLLHQLSGSAPLVYLSWPKMAGDEQLASSPLLQTIPPAKRTDVPHWRESTYRQLLGGASALETLETDTAPAVAMDAPVRGGAGLLALQGRCPARAFLEMRLGAAELPVPAPGIDPGVRGVVVHAVLARFFTEVPDQAALSRLSEPARAERVAAIARQELQRWLPPARLFMRRMAELELRRLAPMLTEFLRHEDDRPQFTVETCENSEQARLGGLLLRVRTDRTDLLAQGQRLIIDYKTGGDFHTRNWLLGRLREPQLPLYALLFDAAAIAVVELRETGVKWHGVSAEDFGLPGVKDVASFSGGRWPDWLRLREAWRESLERVAAEFLGGDFRLDLRDRELALGRWAMLTRIHEQAMASEQE